VTLAAMSFARGAGLNGDGTPARSRDVEAVPRSGGGRSDGEPCTTEDGRMKKRLFITGLIVAALLLALYGVIFGTGAD